MAHRQDNASTTGKKHNALLLGAASTATITEFAQTVRSVHPDANCLVVDIRGERTSRIDPTIAKFLYSDASALPLPDGTVDSIHTNMLLGHLLYRQSQHSVVFSEAYRALSPTGTLIMVEAMRGRDVANLTDLENVGFTDVVSQPAVGFPTRRAMDRALYSKDVNSFGWTENIVSDRALVIVARKQKHKSKS